MSNSSDSPAKYFQKLEELRHLAINSDASPEQARQAINISIRLIEQLSGWAFRAELAATHQTAKAQDVAGELCATAYQSGLF